MDETQIRELIKAIETAKMPEWWKSYCNQIAYNLQVHTKGLMFDKITGLYPNEHPDSQQHCIMSFEAITKGSIWKAINNIIRVFNNSSFVTQISDQLKDIIEEYQESEGSLFSQFLEDWIKNAIATDPNGLCVVYPLDYTDDLYRYISFNDIVLPPTPDRLIFISEKESEVKYEFKDSEYQKEVFFDYENAGGALNVKHTTVKTYNRRLEKKIDNPVYHVFTKTEFIRIWKELKTDTEYKFEWFKFKKELETLPYFENGGVEVENNLYESFVQPFIPFGNLSLMAHRNHRAVDLMFSYPRMAEVQQPCDTCHGKGETECVTSATGWEMCRACKGSKYVTVQSPYKTYRKYRDSFDADDKAYSTPSVEFYSPDPAILDYSKNNWPTYLEMAEEAVFVQRKVQTGNVEAAKSKELDREGLYAWLANIAKVLYGNLQMFLQYQENYLSASPQKVTVEKPYSFAILTESEAFDALRLFLASDSPVSIKANQIDNFINKFVSESSPVKRALHILRKIDLLFYYSNGDVNNAKGQGVVSAQMVQTHILAYPVLIQLFERDETLFEKDDEAIIRLLETEIAKYDLTEDLKTAVLKNAV